MTPQQISDIQHLQQYARRYADGRSTYAATEVNDITSRMIDAGIMPIPDNSGDVFAADGSFASVKAGYVDKYGKDGKGPP